MRKIVSLLTLSSKYSALSMKNIHRIITHFEHENQKAREILFSPFTVHVRWFLWLAKWGNLALNVALLAAVTEERT